MTDPCLLCINDDIHSVQRNGHWQYLVNLSLVHNNANVIYTPPVNKYIYTRVYMYVMFIIKCIGMGKWGENSLFCSFCWLMWTWWCQSQRPGQRKFAKPHRYYKSWWKYLLETRTRKSLISDHYGPNCVYIRCTHNSQIKCIDIRSRYTRNIDSHSIIEAEYIKMINVRRA